MKTKWMLGFAVVLALAAIPLNVRAKETKLEPRLVREEMLTTPLDHSKVAVKCGTGCEILCWLILGPRCPLGLAANMAAEPVRAAAAGVQDRVGSAPETGYSKLDAVKAKEPVRLSAKIPPKSR